ncbi:hypothetical protein HK107_12645 [Parvularcula sp. ZS-1/3]|uniref:MotA/TolQ/ExbB proton channel domain-containing protein n=1 Tax=Parvularcula mediterranea TaxID=2732508 RepID=A0A7Y3RPV0_9PROT|nr:hypothetical protein [Parvularcula mediterranea]NNU17172.1 hypothetical protein [Parvularcula mediterranea]
MVGVFFFSACIFAFVSMTDPAASAAMETFFGPALSANPFFARSQTLWANALGAGFIIFAYALLGVAFLGVFGLVVGPDPAVRSAFTDSIYFLGFAQTLMALTVSLSSFGLDESAGDFTELVRANAIALSTTLVGLVLRNVFAYVVKSGDALEQSNNSAAVLADGLEQASATLDKFEAAVQKLGTSTGKIDQHLSDFNGSVGSEVSALKTKVESAKESIDKISGFSSDSERKIKQASQQIENAATSLGKIEISTDSVEDSLSHMLDRLRGIIDEAETARGRR